MIKVNDSFEFERDQFGWRLIEWRDGVSKDTGEPIRTQRTSFYPTLAMVLDAIIDRAAGKCEDIEELIALMKDPVAKLQVALSGYYREDGEAHVIDGGTSGD